MSTGSGWPRAVVTLDDTGRAEVNVSGIVQVFHGESTEAVRSSVIRFIVQRAQVLDRAIPASITEPGDHWEVVVHQDGTVTENPEAVQHQERPADAPPAQARAGSAPADTAPPDTAPASPTPPAEAGCAPARPHSGDGAAGAVPDPSPGSALSTADGGTHEVPPAIAPPGSPPVQPSSGSWEPGGQAPAGPARAQAELAQAPAVADRHPAPAQYTHPADAQGPGIPAGPDAPAGPEPPADPQPGGAEDGDGGTAQDLPTFGFPSAQAPGPTGPQAPPATVSAPGEAGHPGTPGTPDAPSTPDAPGIPGEPGHPGAPGTPDGTAGTADAAGTAEPGGAQGAYGIMPAGTTGTAGPATSARPGSRREPQRAGPVPGSPPAPAVKGLRGAVNRAGLRLRPSRREQDERADIAAVARPWQGSRTIAVVNGKGGSMKTPTTVLLSAVFARRGGTGVVAYDNCPARGTLGWRTERGPHGRTAADLLASADRLVSPQAGPVEISAFTHHQADRYDVLRSQPGVLAGHRPMTREDVHRIHDVLSHYYRLIVVDSGNDEGSPTWRAMIARADAIVVPTITRPEHAESARLLLDELSRVDEHCAGLAREALVVVSRSATADPGPDSLIPRFQEITRAAVGIPYDPMMGGRPLHLGSLAPGTQRAWLHAAACVAPALH